MPEPLGEARFIQIPACEGEDEGDYVFLSRIAPEDMALARALPDFEGRSRASWSTTPVRGMCGSSGSGCRLGG